MDETTLTCGCICMAARKLGFKLMVGADSGYIYYGWVDLMNNKDTLYGDLCADRQEALHNACIKMQEKLSINA